LESMIVKQSVTLIQLNVQGKKLAFKLDNDKYYVLNDYTINTLMTGLIDENAVVEYKVQEAGEKVHTNASDAEYVANIQSVKMLKLVIVNTKQNKTNRAAGSLSIIILPNSI
jgi:hypothetical protein